MHHRIILLALAVATAAVAVTALASCKSVDCGEGTTERNGTCVPANNTVSDAICGPFTMLDGSQCVPMFPPTTCDPATTAENVDSATGVTTCVGTGGGGCAGPIACPTPTDGTQTICGQIFDFETGATFAATNPTGAACTAAAATGPCSLGIKAYDAVAFVMNPATTPLTTNPVVIDDCGRYRVAGIQQPAGPFVALALDDAMAGPGGTTNAVGVATPKAPNTALQGFEDFIVKGTTLAGWGAGPSLANGIYAAIYRTSSTQNTPAVGVTMVMAPTSNPTSFTAVDPSTDFYFATGSTDRTTLDPAANATTTNGTALLNGASLANVYGGAGGGLPATCIFEPHPGAAVPGAIFIQVFRPVSAPGQTCPL